MSGEDVAGGGGDGAGEIERLLETTHALPILGGIVSLSVVVIIVMLCAKCKERKQNDVQLKEVTAVPDKKKGPLSNGVKASEDGEVKHRHSNGVHDNRPKSHDRALPELPNYGMQDEDDLDPGHYDFIGRKPGTNAYDKIQGEPDTDSGGYAGIPSRATTASSAIASASVPSDPKQHSYATVSNVGDAEYAQIAERGNRSSNRNRFSDVAAGLDTIDGVVVSSGTSGAGAAAGATSGLTPPVVPDRNYEDNEEEEEEPALPSSSPLLPPRNSGVIEAVVVGGAVGGNGDGNGMDIVDGPSTSAAGDNVKGPDYTKVTARESLTHIKLRQQEELLAQQQAEYDNYDQIRTPGATAACPERSSLTSDLYAEITSGSARSSTYARVGELSLPAPTPPPIDSLSRITHTDDDVDPPEPGYSQISRRPHSVVSSGRRSPVYAVVDKSRRPRPQTIAAPDLDVGLDPDPLYSQVHKTGGQSSASYEPHYSQVQKKPPLMSHANGGARARGGGSNNNLAAGGSAAVAGAAGNRSSLASNNPDYHSIQDTMMMLSMQPLDDPDYDQVQEVTAPISPPEEFDEIDPNYAELADTAVVVSVATSHHGAGHQGASLLGQPLLQQATSQQNTTTTTVLRSEPIYQEITEGTML